MAGPRTILLAIGLTASAGAVADPAPGGCTPRLYDNGTFVTAPDGGFGGAPISAMTAPDTMLGFGSSSRLGMTVADDFEVRHAWTVSRLTFYAIGDDPGVTFSQITGVPSLSLWTGVPGGGGTRVAGPVVASMISTHWTGVYRVFATAPTVDRHPIQQVTVQWPASFPTPLMPGTYWLQWNELSLSQFVYTPTLVARSGDNARQNLSADDWHAAIDTGSLRSVDFPFGVCGTTNDPLFEDDFEQ